MLNAPPGDAERHGSPTTAPAPAQGAFAALGRALRLLCQISAIFGGLVFVALVAMSIVSIVGRKIASAPVPGDVEVLQLCAAFASASFFAWCHLNNGDVKVDFFTNRWSHRSVSRLDALGSLLVGAFGTLIAWRSLVGALSLKEAGETTAILGWPVWLGQVLMVPGFVLLALAGFYMCAFHLRGGRAPAEGSL